MFTAAIAKSALATQYYVLLYKLNYIVLGFSPSLFKR